MSDRLLGDEPPPPPPQLARNRLASTKTNDIRFIQSSLSNRYIYVVPNGRVQLRRVAKRSGVNCNAVLGALLLKKTTC